jgi:hypothetical protein
MEVLLLVFSYQVCSKFSGQQSRDSSFTYWLCHYPLSYYRFHKLRRSFFMFVYSQSSRVSLLQLLVYLYHCHPGILDTSHITSSTFSLYIHELSSHQSNQESMTTSIHSRTLCTILYDPLLDGSNYRDLTPSIKMKTCLDSTLSLRRSRTHTPILQANLVLILSIILQNLALGRTSGSKFQGQLAVPRIDPINRPIRVKPQSSPLHSI